MPVVPKRVTAIAPLSQILEWYASEILRLPPGRAFATVGNGQDPSVSFGQVPTSIAEEDGVCLDLNAELVCDRSYQRC
jgi:hypothetical protein